MIRDRALRHCRETGEAPELLRFAGKGLDLLTCGELTFLPPDPVNFPCLAYAVEAAQRGGTACAIMNGANEAAVDLFLHDRIGFNDIPRRVRRAMDTVAVVDRPGLEDILAADRLARDSVYAG